MPSDHVSYLVPARELMYFRLGDARADIRGWPVFVDGSWLVGVVERLLVESATGKIRYVSVALAPSPDAAHPTPPGSVLVPIGVIRLDDNRRAIALESITAAQLAAAPRLRRRPIWRADEDATLAVYGMTTSHGLPRDGLYVGPHFDEERALRPRPNASHDGASTGPRRSGESPGPRQP